VAKKRRSVVRRDIFIAYIETC